MNSTNCLSSRERVRLALEHKETDRIPIAMVCSGINEPVRSEFQQYTNDRCGCDMTTYLDNILDIREIEPPYIGPPLESGAYLWDIHRRPATDKDKPPRPALADAETLDDLNAHPWPSPNWFDYAALSDRIAAVQKDRPRCLMVTNGNPFETATGLRGFEQILQDMILNPQLLQEMLRRVTDFYVEYFRRILQAADSQIDLVFTADDIGGQNGLLFSSALWEKFIRPCHVKLNHTIHQFGVKVIYHSDGAIMEAIPGLCDMGIDILQALQFDARGMDPVALKQQYGNRLSFEGGVSVQRTLPFGTSEQVRREVEHLISVLGRQGGYILGPSHKIQAGTPAENIHALFDAALNFYPFR